MTKSASHRTKIRYDWDPWLGNQRKNSGFWAKMTADSPRADLGPRAVGTPVEVVDLTVRMARWCKVGQVMPGDDR